MDESPIKVRNDQAQTPEQSAHASQFEYPHAARLTKDEICSFIEETGVIPFLNEASLEDAVFIAGALAESGIPIVEISMNCPDAPDLISHLVTQVPTMIVGGGSIRNMEIARQCLNAGARFLSTDGLVPMIAEFAEQEKLAMISGALTLTEVASAWNGGADFVKVVPCHAVGGPSYIRTLKDAMPYARLIAAGGVNQITATNYVLAGVTAMNVGRDLIPIEAVQSRETRRIQELARRYLLAVETGRA
ncbi:MAG: bifunctional 4-hydroxy-2-oxoglutarate aldolase/2-dehydro-3-deoxy-phosphogluconate aldolase [Candidatus Acidiferrales bacterium]|jgi:2-dehydro-3-deoxyphosphogluconate aldolase/(4S)-4-hydroxy-2-oxoglutarate aldolase